MLKVQVNSKATKQMENVLAKIDTFPNRIAAAQTHAMNRSINQIVQKLVTKHKAAKYLIFKIEKVGNLGSRLHIEPPSSSDLEGYYAALTFIKGRKGGRIIKAKNGGAMKLRSESVSKGYPKYLKFAKLGRMQPHEKEIRQLSKDIIIENIKYSLEKQGFGPRGGSKSTEDTPNPRIRL